jgi:cyclic-di-GMP-binding protein
MNIQPLTSPDGQPALQFTDTVSCKRWIEQLPLTNIQQCQQALAAQLAALNTAQVPALERLQMLEALKEPITFVQSESATRYAGKPLPLQTTESAVWRSVTALWEGFGRNYEQCLQAYRNGDLAVAPHAALITMRCLQCASARMLECYRVYRQPPGATWRALHELFMFAERHGIARIRVQDSFAQQDPDSSCTETYVQALLAHLANPYSLSIRQLAFVQRWIENWAALVGLGPQPLPASPIPPLAVDMASNEGVVLAHGLEPHSNLRYLDLEQLSKTLRQTITLLKQGQTPAQLGLGETARQPGCENLLMLLYVQWCRAGTGRAGPLQQVDDEPVNVCFGIAAAHSHVGGRAFRQPEDRAQELSARARRDLDTFGFIARTQHEVAGTDSAGKDDSGLETWQIANQSTSGFMCILREPSGEARVAHNQIIAVRRKEGQQFQLGLVQWLKLDEEGKLCCGVRLFPGTPQPVAVRPSNFTPANSRYEPALFLPEVPAAATPPTLILPPGWFQSGRFIEVVAERTQVAKLLNLLEMGSDFDRCTVTLI